MTLRPRPTTRRSLTRAAVGAAATVATLAAAAAPVQAGTTGGTDPHGRERPGQTAARPQQGPPERTVPGAYLVVLREGDAPAGHATSAMRSRRTTALHRVAAAVGATPVRTTTAALPSFTAHLSAGQAKALSGRPDVLSVRPVRIRRTTVYKSPETLGLTGTGPGSWASYGGTGAAGRGTVIGMVDSGVWPEAPAFTKNVPALGTTPSTAVGTAYRTSPTTTAMRKADGGTFRGDCSGVVQGSPTQAWTPAVCNQAVVAARAFPPGWGATFPSPTDPKGGEYTSPRDAEGHGTHTASTAAGRTVPLSYPDVPAGTQSTGIAPGAALSVYKACWTMRYDDNHDGLWDAGCPDDSLVAAIDQAVRDGVDVISMSISGSRDDLFDPVDLALLGAVRSGVLPVVAAGNDGSAPGTVEHPAPWVMAVGATTRESPLVVDFYSGRGPSKAVGGAFLKPDVVAPGSDIIASVPPQQGEPASTPSYASLMGTSMATPHISGLAALLLASHPWWSPMNVRSALAGRATRLPDNDAFDQGSGMPTSPGAARADLLMNATAGDYDAVLRWAGGGTNGKYPSDLNQANVVFPDVAAHRTSNRVFIPQRRGAWRVSASLPGYKVTVSPRRPVALRPYQRIVVRVTVTRTTAKQGEFSQGALTLDGGRGVTRLPLLARTR